MEKKYCYGIVIAIVIIVILAVFFNSLEEPGVDLTDIKYKSISLSELSISFYVSLDVLNNNPIGATLVSVEADIYIDDQFVGISYSEDEFEINANDVNQVIVVLKVTNAPLGVLGKSTIDVRVTGTAHLKVSFLDFDVPIDKTEVVKIS